MRRKNQKILVILSLAFVSLVALTSLVIAYAAGVRGIGLLGVCFFFTGGIVIVLAQIIPAGIVVAGMIAAAFSSLRKGEMPARTA